MDFVNLDYLLAFATAIAAIIAPVVSAGGQRKKLAQDLEVFKSLTSLKDPGLRSATDALRSSLDVRIQSLSGGGNMSRSVPGIIVGLLFVATAGGLFWIVQIHGGWWALLWIVIGPLGFMGLYGFGESVRKVPRDSKGKAI